MMSRGSVLGRLLSHVERIQLSIGRFLGAEPAIPRPWTSRSSASNQPLRGAEVASEYALSRQVRSGDQRAGVSAPEWQ